MSDIGRLVERTRQNRAALDARLGPSPAAATPESRAGVSLTVGDRVFDTASGEHGEVIGGTVENVVVPTAKR